MSLRILIGRARNAINRKDGDSLTKWLSLQEKSKNFSLLSEFKKQHEDDLLAELEGIGGSEKWPFLLLNHLKTCLAISENQFLKAFDFHLQATMDFNTIFDKEESDWLVSPFVEMAKDLRILAEKAEKEKDTCDAFGKALDALRKAFSLSLNDRRNFQQSKKKAALQIINQLYKIAFKINNLQLCQGFKRLKEGVAFPDVNSFSITDQVTFKFCTGKYELLDANYKQSEEDLTFAFRNCPKVAKKNKRLILLYLVPVRLLAGRYPKDTLLQKYQLNFYIPIVKAIQRGNFQLLNNAIQRNQALFLRKGIYLLLQKTKLIAYRNLFRKVYLIQQTTKLDLKSFESAVKISEAKTDVDIEEIQCIIANLIAFGMMKGYISRQHQKIVLSEKNPFPAFPIETLYS